VKKLWPTVPKENIIMKHHTNTNLNPTAATAGPGLSVPIAENSIIEVIKPEMQIQVPEQPDPTATSGYLQFTMDIKPTDNVKAVKGQVMKRLPSEVRKTAKLTVTFNGEVLNQKQKLTTLDFLDNPVIVKMD
jgi:hypothetical protein